MAVLYYKNLQVEKERTIQTIRYTSSSIEFLSDHQRFIKPATGHPLVQFDGVRDWNRRPIRVQVLVLVTDTEFFRRFLPLLFFYFSLLSLFSSRYLRVSFVQRIVRSVSRRCLEFRTSIVERRNVRFDSREFQLRFTDPATMFAHFVTSFSYERCAESLKCLDSVRLSSRALYTTLLYSIRARHHFRLMELPLRGNRRGNWPLRHRR